MSALLKSVQGAIISGREVSLHQLLYEMKLSGDLLEPFHRAMVAVLVSEAAEREGITVSEDEAQVGADRYREQLGLHSAADTRMWLREEGMSEEDFEARVEGRVAAGKLRSCVTEPGIEAYFEEHKAEFGSRELTDSTRRQIESLLWDRWLQEEVDRRDALFVLPSLLSA